MPPPSASGPDEPPPPLSPGEREILARIEHDLEASSPGLARKMARPMTAAPGVPARVVEAGFLVLSLFLVLTAAGLVPVAVWVLLAAIGFMIVVPCVMLLVLERFDRTSDDG
jgi:hypothetical protein